MQSSTQRFLRVAIQEALKAEDDAAAIELMAILSGHAQPQSVAALPSHQSTTPGPAHDCHFWAQFIRENFIPFISNNGRSRFTSYELFSWVQNYADLPLTDGDIEQRSGGAPVFRKRISGHWIYSSSAALFPPNPEAEITRSFPPPPPCANLPKSLTTGHDRH